MNTMGPHLRAGRAGECTKGGGRDREGDIKRGPIKGNMEEREREK